MENAEVVTGGLSMVQAGDVPDFADAVKAHQSLVFSMAYHLLHSVHLAEETAQDVFLRLYRDYDKIASASHLVHWLRRTTTHRCLDLLRSSDKRLQVPLDDVEIPLLPPEPDLLLARRIRRLVAGLPAIARAVVVLRYQEDLEPREIAEVLELSVNTVKSRLNRALNVLRGRLASIEELQHASDRR
jgi:RNA polymerase sigma-70 factor (ECF subfamily)